MAKKQRVEWVQLSLEDACKQVEVEARPLFDDENVGVPVERRSRGPAFLGAVDGTGDVSPVVSDAVRSVWSRRRKSGGSE